MLVSVDFPGRAQNFYRGFFVITTQEMNTPQRGVAKKVQVKKVQKVQVKNNQKVQYQKVLSLKMTSHHWS